MTRLIARRLVQSLLLVSLALTLPKLPLELWPQVLAPGTTATGCGELVFLADRHGRPLSRYSHKAPLFDYSRRRATSRVPPARLRRGQELSG